MCCFLAYGSIIDSSYSSNYGSGLEDTKFKDSELKIPVALGRLSSRINPKKSRVTLIPDAKGVAVPLYFSATQLSLEEAKKALMMREGMRTDKSLLVISAKKRIIHPAFNKKTIVKVQRWLKKNGFQYGLVTAFSANTLPKHLSGAVHKRSLEYFNNLPQATREALMPQAKKLGYFEKRPATTIFNRIFGA